VATRKALTSIRSDSRRRKYEAKYAADRPLETTSWEDISVHVDEEMDNLDDQTRVALIEHFFEGRSRTDIAAASGVSRPTVSRRIDSGVSQLRSKLRARGLIVGSAVFGTLLLQNAAQAAPAVVLEELGKIAIVGSSAAAVSGIGSAAAASGASGAVTATGAGVKAAGAGIFASVQAKIVTAAAVAAVGVGGVVTYNQTKQPSEQSEQSAPVVKSVDNDGPEVTTVSAPKPKPAALSVSTDPKRVAPAAEPKPSSTISTPTEEPVANSSTEEAAEKTGRTTRTRSSRTPPRTSGGSRWSYAGPASSSAAEETTEDSNSSETKVRATRSTSGRVSRNRRAD
jgi:hypothetical protein